ncbi:hypothetical protein M1394_02530 [Candidatus Marsarchaeota archaeon]|nr:hypothetical protein [Candidatus Marsarchaeota archaeon]
MTTNNGNLVDVSFDEALGLICSKKSKIIWLGREPIEYISNLLDLPKGSIVAIDPDEMMHADMEKARSFDSKILMCYHGVTSKFVGNHLKRENINLYNLKGGITSIVGEIF